MKVVWICIRIVSFISHSNSKSHFSTCPRALAVEIAFDKQISSPYKENSNGTFLKHVGCYLFQEFEINTWADFIAVTSKFSLKISELMPLKHFFRCDWICVGSFVSAKISSKPSFDRKKNLGKYSRFFSKYYEKKNTQVYHS